MINVLTCILNLGGSVIDSVLMNKCGAPIVNAFKIDPMSQDSDYNPLHLHIATKNSYIDLCLRVQKKEVHYATLVNEVKSHVMNLSLLKM